MNRSLHNTENTQPPRANKLPNYAQAARSSSSSQQQQQTRGSEQTPQQQSDVQADATTAPHLRNPGSSNYNSQQHAYSTQNYKNSYKPKDNTYNNNNSNYNKKAPVQLPLAPPTDTAPIQFGSVNQPSNIPLPTTTGKTGDIPVLRTSEVQFGSLTVNDSATSSNNMNIRPQIRVQHQQQQQHQNSHNHHHPQHQQKSDIPRSPRTTNDNRLFTQPYVPRQNLNQGGGGGGGGEYTNNNNNHNHHRYNSNNNNYNNNNTRHNYGRPPPIHHQQSSPHQIHHYPGAATATVVQQQHHSPQHPSPQHQQQHLPPSPMSIHRASPNMTYQQQKKTNVSSPHIPHSSPQNSVQMTATWSPNQYYYHPQYPVQVQPYNVMPAAATRSPIIPPQPAPRKVIAIVDPNTGNTLNTNPIALNASSPALSNAVIKEAEKLDFKVPAPHVSKAVSIVDPAIRDRELREKREREEAEQEALKKSKEEEEERKKEAERKEQEEKERLEREAKEKEEAERLEAERLEAERLETERRLATEAEAVKKAEAEALAAKEKKKQEEAEAARKKEEEETELKRVLSESEAKKRREEQDRIIAVEIASQKVGRVPTKLDMSTIPPFTQSPVTTPMANNNSKKQLAGTTPKKILEDPGTIQYPAGIQAPPAKQETDGKFTYSIEFLLQFQQLCLETEEDLSAIMKEMGSANANNNNSMRQHSDRGRTPRTPGNPGTATMGGDAMFRIGSRDGRMEMGKFNMGRPLTARMNSTHNSHMERQGSSRGGGGMSNRGGRGGSSGMKVTRNPPQGHQQHQHGAPTIPMEQVAPLEKSQNRWVPVTQVATAAPATTTDGEIMTQEFITRKVNALLNKLTMERFDSIATQIFEYAKQSAKEDDGRSLRTVMKLTFEKACDEPAFASMWAQLCRHMYDSMTDEIRDTSILNEAKQPSSGVLLFRKYLFNRCQVEFEKGWKVNMPEVDEVDGMMTEEYYVAAKAKRQGLGLIQFIGELFKLEMLSERIMYSCMIKLCNDPANAGDEEAESLCKLLTTIGKALDSKAKTSKWVDVVIGRMKNEMVNSPKLTSRIKFMIQDLLDLRKDKWIPRNATGNLVGPTTIAKIHEMAEKAKEEKEAAAAMKRNTSSRGGGGQYIPNNQYNNTNGNNHNMARTGSYRGGRDQHHFQPHNNNNNNTNNNSNHSVASEGWSTVGSNTLSPGGSNTGAQGGSNKSRPSNDLSNFGKTDRSRSRTNILGPSNSPFPSLSRGKSTVGTETKGSGGDGRSSPATNMFSALLNGGEKIDERKKLQLAPRTIETTSSDETQQPSSEPTTKLSDDAIKRKSKNILEEYFGIRDKRELVECIKELDDSHYLVLFIGEMLTVVEKKAVDVEKMVDVIKYLNTEENLLEKDLYIRAFKNFMEGYEDLTIDVPQAPKYVAQLLLASSITPEEVDEEGINSLKDAYKKVSEEEAN